MKLRALMNRLEDLGEDRHMIVRIPGVELSIIAGPNANTLAVVPAREYDVVGVDSEGPDPEDGLAILILRERPPVSD